MSEPLERGKRRMNGGKRRGREEEEEEARGRAASGSREPGQDVEKEEQDATVRREAAGPDVLQSDDHFLFTSVKHPCVNCSGHTDL